MHLYYGTSRLAVRAVLSYGFSDADGAGRSTAGVELSDRYGGDEATILVDLPEDAVAPFEVTDPESPARRFAVPASIVNAHPIVAVRGVNGVEAGAPKPAKARRLSRASMAAIELGVALVVAGLVYALLQIGGDESSGPPARQPVQRPAAPPRQAVQGISASGSHSRAIGSRGMGRLVGGVPFPREGKHFFTWDATRQASPNPRGRRYGADYVVRTVQDVIDAFAAAHPDAARVGVADLSRRHGGDFGVEFGGHGHIYHQNGLDVDILYPRRDGRERSVDSPEQIDLRFAQELIQRFIRAGAVRIFVGPDTGLVGVSPKVRPLTFHDDHFHVSFPKQR
jgi:hypothetical protein